MNSIKNLLIVGVLAAVGYGVFVSLSRNTETGANANSSAQGWPSAPKVEMPGATGSGSAPAAGGSNTFGSPTGVAPLAPSSARPSLGAANGAAGGMAPASPFLPPPAAAGTPAAGGAPANVVPVVPYPSSTPPPGFGTPAAAAVMPSNAMPSTAMPSATPAAAGNQATPSDVVRNLGPPPEVLAGGMAAPSAAAPAPDAQFVAKFNGFMEAVQKKLDEGKLADAHKALSTLYGNPDLPAEQTKQLTQLLDQLAGSVIYSRQSYLEKPYVVQPGDTIEKVAQQCSVPWELLARINGLLPADPAKINENVKSSPLPPNSELKVIRGPFDVVISLGKHQLTLMIQDRYAGRFPIGVGRDQPSLEGTYTVRDKSLNPPYYGADGVNINPGDPKNPLGGAWIGLTDRIGIHGTNDPQGIGRDDNRGTISVASRDLNDLYGILTVGSRVVIQK